MLSYFLQVKRVPYTRQQTYTKFSEGLVNLGFDENADARHAQKPESISEEAAPDTSMRKNSSEKRQSPKRDIKEEGKEGTKIPSPKKWVFYY